MIVIKYALILHTTVFFVFQKWKTHIDKAMCNIWNYGFIPYTQAVHPYDDETT